MQVCTLIAAPGSSALTRALVDGARRDLDGGDARWLAPGEAAEFPCPHAADDAWAGGLREAGIDVAFQPGDRRPRRLLLADMDSTMIRQECIDELADEAGVGARVSAITARAMNGELDFEEALRERVALLAGLPVETATRVLETRIAPMPGGRTLVRTMRARGAHAALVSGGFTRFTSAVAERLGFHEHRGNVLEEADGVFTGRVVPPILGREAKVEALEELTARLGLTPADALAVGDGANDLGMLERAGLGVALHAKPAVAARARVRIDHGDLTALLYLQGIAADQFER